MEFLVNSFVNILLEAAAGLMGYFTGDFWKNLGITLKGREEGSGGSPGSVTQDLLAVGGKFDEWLPGVQELRESFIWIGLFFVLILMFAGLLKAFLPDGISESAEHPFSVIGRAVGAGFCVFWAFQIMYFLQWPMAALFDGIYDLSKTSKNMASGFNFNGEENVSNVSLLDIIEGDGGVGDLLSDFMGGLGGLLLIAFLVFAVLWMFAKLILEMVERYVTTCFLFYVSPLAFCTIASKSTQGIASNFIRMLFAQYLLIMFNCIFLFVFCYAYSQIGTHTYKEINELIIFFIAMMAWLKLGQRLDEHMNTLGLGAARTGAGLGGEILGAAFMTMAAGRAAGKMLRNGAGFTRGVAKGTASDKTTGGRIGNKINDKVPQGVKDKQNAAYNKVLDAAAMPQGIKGAANGVLSSKTLAAGAMGPRVTTGAAGLAAAQQSLHTSSGASLPMDSAEMGNGHIKVTQGGQTYDFIPQGGKAVAGPSIPLVGPDGNTWVASLKDSYGNVNSPILETDFARQALGTDSVNRYLNGKWGGSGFGQQGGAAGISMGYDPSGSKVTFADASIYRGDANARNEVINGKEMLVMIGWSEDLGYK